jgi:hypothetical protein
MDIYIYIYQFHVVVFFFSPSLSLTVTTMVLRIATLTIPYDSDDYVIHAFISLFFLCPRNDDILNYMFIQFYIADNVEYCVEGRRRQGLRGRRADTVEERKAFSWKSGRRDAFRNANLVEIKDAETSRRCQADQLKF